MSDRRVRQYAMSQVEDVRPSGKCMHDATDSLVQRRSARIQDKRIEIALHRQAFGQCRVRPNGVNGLIQPQRVDAGPPRIGCKLCACALWKRSEEHTSELQSLMRISYAVFCLKKTKNQRYTTMSLSRI